MGSSVFKSQLVRETESGAKAERIVSMGSQPNYTIQPAERNLSMFFQPSYSGLLRPHEHPLVYFARLLGQVGKHLRSIPHVELRGDSRI